MNSKDKMRWAAQHKRSLESFIYVEFIDRPPSKIPYLEFGDDMDCYTDGTRIHLGMKHFEIDDEEELFWDVYYVLGHELQHIKSTTNRDWTAAIKQGIRNTCDVIAVRVLGRKVRLVKDSDYQRFMNDIANKGYHLSFNRLGEFVHFVCNSLEDGRIEAIRSKKHRNFMKYMKHYRAKSWDASDVTRFFSEKEKIVKESNLDPVAKLQIVLNQILSLSTTGIYQKGFLREYGTSDLCKTVQGFIPNIARAVTAKTCRACMKEAVEIVAGLGDLLVEASQMSDFEKLISDISKMIQSAVKSTYSATSKTEEQGDGTPGEALFGNSVLVIELDEEEFEKMKENADESVENPSVIFVKKGDKEQENEQGDDLSENGSGQGSNDNAQDTEEDQNADSNMSNSNSKDEQMSDMDGDWSSDGNVSENHALDAMHDGGEDESTSTSAGKNATESVAEQKKSDQMTQAKSEGSRAATDDEIQKMIDKAKETPKTPEIEISEADIQKQKTFADKMSEFKNPTPPVKADLSGIDANYDYPVDFEEEYRKYKPDKILPVILESKGNALKNKIESILKQKRKPDERGMRAGSLDSGRLTNLIFSESTCFKRRGEEHDPDVAGFLLMDNSGSMGNGQGSNRFYCCNAISIIEHAFSNVMPLKIAAFDAYGSERVNHFVIKDFEENGICNYTYNFYSQGRTGFGNKDGYSIRVATEQLLQRQEEEKVLIIASDGLPSDYYGGFQDGINDVKSAVANARKHGIKVIGLYMFQDQRDDDISAFETMYAPEYLLCQLDDIEDELSRVMKSLFR